METMESKVDVAVSAVCPIESVSFHRRIDKSTWVIKFKPEATIAQQLAARTVLTNFDVDAAIAGESAQRTSAITDSINARADTMIVALQAMTPAQARTWVGVNVNSLADAKTLLGTMAAVLCVLARRL